MACAGRGGADAARQGGESAHTVVVEAPVMPSADSLFSFVEMQCALGPRVPGSAAHSAAVNLITSRLEAYGVEGVNVSGSEAVMADGRTLPVRNIFGSINPDASRRIILLAHYDSRPWADEDPDPSLRSQAVDGANDGASGVAVMLETARLLGHQLPDSIGVDLLFTDLEDSGTSGNDDTWCIGARQWAQNLPYAADRMPRMGILLDMVGGQGALFHREILSHHKAPQAVNAVWAAAKALGLERRFPNQLGGAVTDDHLPLIAAGIPTVDIIESRHPETGTFNPTWHTTYDTPANIDRGTLRDVTRVVLHTIYNL